MPVPRGEETVNQTATGRETGTVTHHSTRQQMGSLQLHSRVAIQVTALHHFDPAAMYVPHTVITKHLQSRAMTNP